MISRFFIDRPIFAAVLSIVMTLAGGLAVFNLPLAMYPPIAPPTVQVDCKFPGASARDVAEAVAAPIEQQVNGVEGMLYMSSQCTNDGSYNLTVTFKHGVDLNMAQVLVQNRVALALPMLPDVIKQAGVTARKRSPDILMAIAINSPNNEHDQLYLSNYALMHVKEELARLPGVSDINMLGQQDYSMRVWVDPDALAARELSALDVVRAIREQNRQVAAGQIGQPPVHDRQPFQITLDVLGRLKTPEQFEQIVVKTLREGQVVRLKDVARVQIGAKNLDVSTRVNGRPSVSLAIFLLPDANALETGDLVKAKIKEMEKDFPPGVAYEIRYDTTPFIRESIDRVIETLQEAVVLVAIVVLFFLQSWRSAVVPLIAVPVAIIGTFGVMAMLGFSINNLTLFGLVLAIGIVVDDAIVVVESIEYHMEHGLPPREASIVAMHEVSGPIIAIGLVLTSVFVPCAFLTGITGQFFRQFALTIAASTVISTINSLTLSPALAAILLKPPDHERSHGRGPEPLPRWGIAAIAGWFAYRFLGPQARELFAVWGDSSAAAWMAASPYVVGLVGAFLGWLVSRPMNWVLAAVFGGFNALFRTSTQVYTWGVGKLLRVAVLVPIAYVYLLQVTATGFESTPKGFIPSQDMGYLLLNVQLADSASLQRTLSVMNKVERITRETPGVKHTQSMTGQSLLLSAFGSNFGSMFIILKPFTERPDPLGNRLCRWLEKPKTDPEVHQVIEGLKAGTYQTLKWCSPDLESAVKDWVAKKAVPTLSGEAVADELRRKYADLVPEAQITVLPPPPLRGVGRAGGFKLLVEDRSGEVLEPLEPGAAARGLDAKVPETTASRETRRENVKKAARGLARLQEAAEDLVADANGAREYTGAGAKIQLLPSLADSEGIPTSGKDLIVIAQVGDSLRLRVFDRVGKVVLDAPEAELTEQSTKMADLKTLLKDSWPPREPPADETSSIIKTVAAIATDVSGNTSVFGVNGQPKVTGLASVFRAKVPQLYVDVDRRELMSKQVSPRELFLALQVYLGSLYVNDFDLFGRTWQVIVQADARFRNDKDDVRRIKVRNRQGQMVPIGALATIEEVNGPLILTRYNMYTAAPVTGSAAAGVSSGDAIDLMEELGARALPSSMALEWTELAFLERQANTTTVDAFGLRLYSGSTAILVFSFAVVMVFLVLAAQYESWSMPLAVILVVPMCLLCAIGGLKLANEDINIFTQIGLVVLVGLACKNAILIVEYAKSRRDAGETRRQAALDACKLRFRPILMTSLAFILGVLPLLRAHGAGAEMRRTLGTTVFSGMLGVTLFGVVLTPAFFVLVDWVGDRAVFRSRPARVLGSVLLAVLTLGVIKHGVRLAINLAGRRRWRKHAPVLMEEVLPPVDVPSQGPEVANGNGHPNGDGAETARENTPIVLTDRG